MLLSLFLRLNFTVDLDLIVSGGRLSDSSKENCPAFPDIWLTYSKSLHWKQYMTENCSARYEHPFLHTIKYISAW